MPEAVGKSKRFYHIAGYLVVLACLGFVGYRMADHWAVLEQALSNPQVLLGIAGAGAAYALFYGLLALGWHVFLRLMHGPIPFGDTYFIYSRTSIAKYLPGNIGHFVGRHLIASRFGLAQAMVGISTALEILCQNTAALMICLWIDLPMVPALPPSVSFVIALGIIVCAPFAILWIGRRKGLQFDERFSLRSLWLYLCSVCGLDLVFFLSSGFLVYFLASVCGISTEIGMMSFMSVYAVAWFLGLVTPGAPAGMGVREAVIIAMLEGAIGPSDALVVAVLFRVTTTVGDLLFFGSSFLFRGRGSVATNE